MGPYHHLSILGDLLLDKGYVPGNIHLLLHFSYLSCFTTVDLSSLHRLPVPQGFIITTCFREYTPPVSTSSAYHAIRTVDTRTDYLHPSFRHSSPTCLGSYHSSLSSGLLAHGTQLISLYLLLQGAHTFFLLITGVLGYLEVIDYRCLHLSCVQASLPTSPTNSLVHLPLPSLSLRTLTA